jgi:hypothetical protein
MKINALGTRIIYDGNEKIRRDIPAATAYGTRISDRNTTRRTQSQLTRRSPLSASRFANPTLPD